MPETTAAGYEKIHERWQVRHRVLFRDGRPDFESRRYASRTGAGLLLSYVQIIQRVAEKDPTLKDTINIDTLKLAPTQGWLVPKCPPK